MLRERKKRGNSLEAKKQMVLNLLHLTRKAGKLKLGFDACERSILSGKSDLLLFCSDLSQNTQNRLQNLLKKHNTKSKKFGTVSLLGNAFKTKDLGILSIEDKNFASGILRLIG